jgi:hypothetical protein
MKLQIQGFLNDARQRKGQFKQILDGRTFVDGLRLNEIQISVSLTSKQDVKDLINLLEVAKFTFDEPNCKECGRALR